MCNEIYENCSCYYLKERIAELVADNERLKAELDEEIRLNSCLADYLDTVEIARDAALEQLAERKIDLCELRTWITAATFYYPDKFPLSCNRERFDRAMSPHPDPEPMPGRLFKPTGE